MSDPIDSRRMTRSARASQENDEEAALLVAELDSVMDSLLEPLAPSAELWTRLQATVAQPPQRYAPFFGRVAELFDLPEAAVVAEFARLAEPKVWRFSGLPGVRNVLVQGGPKVEGAETVFARFAPGTRFPRHRHTGVEKVLVLEGQYEDSAGIVHHAGEFREWLAGTNHGFRVSTSEPCIIASVVYGREFEALPLRLLARALGH
jgi:anti-sigma factor ChrR (cupin superfamily)